MRRAAKVDGNQGRIVKALEAIGCTVHSLAAVGEGCPDIVVGYHGHNYLLEIKDPDQPPSKRALTPAQVVWHDSWRGQVAVVETVEEAIEVMAMARVSRRGV